MTRNVLFLVSWSPHQGLHYILEGQQKMDKKIFGAFNTLPLPLKVVGELFLRPTDNSDLPPWSGVSVTPSEEEKRNTALGPSEKGLAFVKLYGEQWEPQG